VASDDRKRLERRVAAVDLSPAEEPLGPQDPQDPQDLQRVDLREEERLSGGGDREN